jgi:hypothetical protein
MNDNQTPPRQSETLESIESDRLDPIPTSWLVLFAILGIVILALLSLGVVMVVR